MLEGVHADVQAAVESEADRAKEQWGARYHSWHEAYGVLAEEKHEVQHELKFLDYYWDDLNRALHGNQTNTTLDAVDNIRVAAIRAACELVQVAAVCSKASSGVEVPFDA